MVELKKVLATIGLACAMMCSTSSAFAQAPPEITAQTLIDRAKIEDMLTRYMTELGHSTIEASAGPLEDSASASAAAARRSAAKPCGKQSAERTANP